ncbi:hypothetical protein [Deinococcus cavernae]|nr:hypothetical protein [Deinococcus cavernae]
MPMNRSPCAHLLTLGLLVNPFDDPDALRVPPGKVALQESEPQRPPRLTPELIREQGVQAHQIDRNVSLHDTPIRLGEVREVGREAITVGGNTVELVKFRADIAICDVINLNYRFYPRSAYEGAIERAQAAMAQGKLTGLLEHPGWDDGWKGRLDNIAARWTALGIEEKEVEFPPESGVMVMKPVVWGEGVYTRTSGGELIQVLMQDGVFVGISTNGYSSVKWMLFSELGIPDPSGMIDPDLEIPVTGDDFTLLTIDFVSLPANSGGQVYAESGGYGPPPTRPAPIAPPTRPAQLPESVPRALEEPMHPKLKALLERLGKTLEQVKAEHAGEYLTTLEAIAAEGQASTEAASQLAAVQAQLTTTQTQLAQAQASLRQSEQNRVQESRTAMVDKALDDAALPQLPPLEIGNESIDLNAKFREGLLSAVLAAESDESAQALLTQQIAIRAHELAGQAENALGVRPARVPAAAPQLPIGDNDKADALAVNHEASNVLVGNPYITRLRG